MIDDDGFALGDVTSDPPGTDPIPSDWIVSDQKPNPGKNEAFGTNGRPRACPTRRPSTCP